MRTLENAVVVITGASSGLGRAAAHAFAREGCRLVLAARSSEALREAARECRRLGASAAAVVTDVARESEVRRLAARATAGYGRIDVWVNNAAITTFTPLVGADFAPSRDVLEVNLFGAIYGARAALAQFERQGSGVLINVGSILSQVGHPFVPAYAISKFGLRGLTESLRAAYADRPGIFVCGLYPYAIDTPHMEAAGKTLARRPHPLPPVQSPEKVAAALVSLARRPRHEMHVPRYFRLAVGLKYLLPGTTDYLLLKALDDYHLGPSGPADDGREHASDRPHRVHGNANESPSTARVAAGTALRAARLMAWRLRHPRQKPAGPRATRTGASPR